MALVADGLEPLKVTGGAHLGQLLRDAGRRAPPRTHDRAWRFRARAHARGRDQRASCFERHFASNPAVIGRTRRSSMAWPHEVDRRHAARLRVPRAGHRRLGAAAVRSGTRAEPQRTFSQAFARLQPGVTAERRTRELQRCTPAMRRSLEKTERLGTRRSVSSRCRTR